MQSREHVTAGVDNSTVQDSPRPGKGRTVLYCNEKWIRIADLNEQAER